MIEVEKKFLLSDAQRILLLEDSDFIEEKIMTDIYYDTEDFLLTKNDKWLRNRSGKFELKLPVHKGVERIADQYLELVDDFEIKKALNLVSEDELVNVLGKSGFDPFCICKTTRRNYKNGIFSIDVDEVSFQEFSYSIAEIELMVNNLSEIGFAENQILDFSKNYGLNISYVRGKVLEYLKRIKPVHYKALVDAGVVKAD